MLCKPFISSIFLRFVKTDTQWGMEVWVTGVHTQFGLEGFGRYGSVVFVWYVRFGRLGLVRSVWWVWFSSLCFVLLALFRACSIMKVLVVCTIVLKDDII